jgi:hypothetical protein
MTYPYEDLDIAQMRAEMLHKAQDLPYDDGEYLLSQNPDLLQVGLFGRGPKPVKPVAPVDLGRRRAFGLPETPMSMPATGESVNAMVPVPQPASPQQPATPMAPAQPSPQQPAPQQPSNPLGQLANKALNAPISRREVLKKAGQVAINQALPTPKVADVVPEIVSPLAQVAQNVFTPNKNIDFFLKDYLHRTFDEAYAQEPAAVTQSMWLFMRDYLKDKLPEDRVKTLDKLAKLKNGKYAPDSSDDISDDDAHALSIHLHSHIRDLNPHEMVNVLEELGQQGIDSSELHYEMKHHYKPPELPKNAYIGQRNKELGLNPAAIDYHGRLNTYSQLTGEPVPSFENISPVEFEQYLNQSYEQAQKSKKASNSKE